MILSFLIFILAESIGLWYINSYLEVPIERMNAVNWIYQFSIISCILSITQVPYSADIIAHERINIYAYIGIVEGIFKLILTMSLFLLNEWDKLIFMVHQYVDGVSLFNFTIDGIAIKIFQNLIFLLL